jgi:hypothetical protein
MRTDMRGVPCSLQGLLFHKDFKKQCEAADAVRNVLPTLYDRVYAVVDLLFR